MKKIFILFLGFILLPVSAQSADFKEGENYTVISQTASEKPQVTEYFSFYCGHCRAFEPIMKALKPELLKGVAFKKNHVNFLGGEMGVALTNAYAAAEILQVEDIFADLVFNHLQIQRKKITGEEDILDIFEQAGVNRQEAKSALQSFTVVGRASQMKRNTEKSAIRGVPAVIVNGKYEVNRGSVKDTKEFIALVNYLTQKKD